MRKLTGMKYTLLAAGLMLVGLTGGCKKSASVAPTVVAVLSANLNGEVWEAEKQAYPRTSVTDTYAYTPKRFIFSVEGQSQHGIPSLHLSRFTLSLAFSYLPKIGRHSMNSGSVNAQQHYCQGTFYFDAPDGVTYHADATSGYVDITEIADGNIKGTFAFTCTSRNMPATSGAPAVFTVTNGQFYDRIDSGFPDQLVWDGVQ